MTQSVTAVWSNLYAVCQSLFPTPVLVSFGDPGNYQPDVIVAVMGGKVPIGRPTMGTNRSRDKECTATVIISAYQPGGDAAQALAFATAQGMCDQLEAYFRVAGNEKLGGACWDAWLSSADPDFAIVRDGDGIQTGSVTEITVTLTARVRI